MPVFRFMDDDKEIALRILLKLIDKGLLKESSDDPAKKAADAYKAILTGIREQGDQDRDEGQEQVAEEIAAQVRKLAEGISESS